jgi:hypothetical protein
MNAPKSAAQFAAYVWYEKCRAGRQSSEEAARFARENWTAFLSVAHEGWGKLLIRMAIRRAGQRRKRQVPAPSLIGRGSHGHGTRHARSADEKLPAERSRLRPR